MIAIRARATAGRPTKQINPCQNRVPRRPLAAPGDGETPRGVSASLSGTASGVGLASGGRTSTARWYARVTGLEGIAPVLRRSRLHRLSWRKAPPAGRFVLLPLVRAALGPFRRLP